MQDSPSLTFSVSGRPKVFDVNKNFTRNTDFCESFQRNRFLLPKFSYNKVCTTLLVFASHFCIGWRFISAKCEDEYFRFKPIGKTLLPLLFLSPGARKFLMLTKISQEMQIFAKAFKERSFYCLIIHFIKSAQFCVFSQVISAKIERLFT